MLAILMRRRNTTLGQPVSDSRSTERNSIEPGIRAEAGVGDDLNIIPVCGRDARLTHNWGVE
jgi:hypothetical protein